MPRNQILYGDVLRELNGNTENWREVGEKMTNNREIKFKGFHRDETGKEKIFVNGEWVKGYWVYGVPVFEEDRCYIIQNLFICSHCCLCTCTKAHVIPETVGQYTNLKDKNGKEIFEGNIVKFFGMKGKITRECGAFGIGTSKQINYDKLETKIPYGNSPAFCYNDNFISLWELWWNYEQDDNPLYEVEVIGNIYENPEMLEVK